MKEIIFKDITKSYDGKTNVLNKLNLTIDPGQRVILLGPSGCGKSTILRMIAGLEEVNDGELIMNERVVNTIPPEDRNVSMVFQNYALYPHMTVRENIEYALKLKKMDKQLIKEKTDQAIQTLQLEGLDDRKPRDLSGGQRQRVALARAIVKDTDYLLLDEPLSNLDAQLRAHSRQELVRLHQKFGMTMVYVTHDQVEAMTVGQKIILLNKGKIQMAGTPEEIYHHPVNIFTATFIGSPAMNILLSHYEDHKLFTENGLAVPINEDLQKQIEGHGNPDILLGIRPEKIRVCPEATDRSLPVKINYMEDYGSRLCLFFDVNGKNYSIIVDSLSARIGDTIQVEFPDEDLVLFDGETGENIMGPYTAEKPNSQTMSLGKEAALVD